VTRKRVPPRRRRLTGSKIQAASLIAGKIERSAEALRVYQPPDIISLQT
jgi:hypothetical protein